MTSQWVHTSIQKMAVMHFVCKLPMKNTDEEEVPHWSFVLPWWTSLSVSACVFVFPWITLGLFILFVILCCLPWTVFYCGLIYVSLLPDLMPVFALRVALSLLLCLLVIDPDCTTKITIKLQMDPHFAEASLQLSEVFSLYYGSAINRNKVMHEFFCQQFDVFLDFY